MHFDIFAIRENHNDDKSDKKQCGKNELTCGKHDDNILRKAKQLNAKVFILQHQLIPKNHAKTTSRR